MASAPHPDETQIRAAMAALEAQRALLGDAVVDMALVGLRQQLAVLEAQAAAEAAPSEERRPLTILFADIVGSTAIAEQMDAEEWRRAVAGFHAAAGAAIEAHGGTVAQFLGDGLLAFFGAQAAAEHDPENGIRAALALQTAVADLPPAGPAGARLQSRVGVHTGPVVIGELGSDAHKEITATGDAMNLAARLQAAAPAGGVLISHDAYRHVRGVFDLTPRPPLTVKGKREPIQTYVVRRAKPRAFRSAAARGLIGVETPTIGREAELAELQAAYERALQGGTAVWAQLVGEPGIGKSRLLEDMREWIDLRPEPVRVLRGRAFSDDAGQPYSLIRRMWLDRFLIADDTPLAAAEARWVKSFQDLAGSAGEEPAHALGRLIGLPFAGALPAGAAPPGPQEVRGRAYVVSHELLAYMRAQGPVVLLLEDLHWADTASWDWLAQVAAQPASAPPPHIAATGAAHSASPDAPQIVAPDHAPVDPAAPPAAGLFVLASARPVWQPPWHPEPAPPEREGFSYQQLDLQPLDGAAREALVRELLARVEGVPEDVIQAVIERSEGVPYFAEELINWFVDRGLIDRASQPWQFVAARLPEAPLPATLQHLLFTRLTALAPPERAALQRGAIFGRNFWSGGVEALGAPGGRVLSDLQPRGFVRAQPESAFEGETEWSFHHALLREVTYESVLKRERAALHKAAAAWLEEQAGRAGRLEEFSGLLAEHAERAGERDTAADWYLRAAGRSLAQGAALEAARFYGRALELTPPVERERRWRALAGREAAYAWLSDRPARQADLEAMLALAHEANDPELMGEAHYRQATMLRHAGDGPGAATEAAAALNAATLAGSHALAAKALGVRAQALVRVGRGADAMHDADQALALARQSGDDDALGVALYSAGFAYGESGHPDAFKYQQESVALARRRGDRGAELTGLLNMGVFLETLGHHRESRAALEDALRLAQLLGIRRSQAYALGNLAETAISMEDLRRARGYMDAALETMIASGDVSGEGWILALISIYWLELGDTAAALQYAERCAEIKTELQDRATLVYLDMHVGLIRFQLGELDEARMLGLRSWRDAEALARAGHSMALDYYARLLDLLDAAGETQALREAAEFVHAEIMTQAARLDDPEWRRVFIEEHAYNRRIIRHWERLNAGRPP